MVLENAFIAWRKKEGELESPNLNAKCGDIQNVIVIGINCICKANSSYKIYAVLYSNINYYCVCVCASQKVDHKS
jgi:hypothetical protein